MITNNMSLFNYSCSKCSYTNKQDGSGLFTLEREDEDKDKKAFCPECGNTVKLMGQVINTTSNLEQISAQRSANKKAGRQAQEQAVEYSRSQDNEKMVTVQPPKGERGQPIQVKQSVMDRLEQKSQDFIDQL